MPGMEGEERKSIQVSMPSCHHRCSVLWPTPGKKQKDDSIMLGSPELIAECLNGQRAIPFGTIVDQRIGTPTFCDGLPDEFHRLASGILLILCFVLRSFLPTRNHPGSVITGHNIPIGQSVPPPPRSFVIYQLQ